MDQLFYRDSQFWVLMLWGFMLSVLTAVSLERLVRWLEKWQQKIINQHQS